MQTKRDTHAAIVAVRSRALMAVLTRADWLLGSESKDADTARKLAAIATELASESVSASRGEQRRLWSLTETVERIAHRLS